MPDVDNLLTSFYQLDDEARQEVVETIRLKLQYHRDPERAEQIKQIKGWKKNTPVNRNIRRSFFLVPFWHRWSDFSILNLSVFHLTDKCFAVSNLINLRTILFLEYRKTPEALCFWGILRLDTTLSCDNKSIFRWYYSGITR